MSNPRVFISYSHDSDEHKEKVRGLAASLSRDGFDCRLDVFKDSDEDWPSWMTRQLMEADFVLCVVTETYARRFSDNELPDVGLGVGWEAGLIRRLLYAKKLRNNRIFPVVFAASGQKHIPIELQGYDFFLLDATAGYEALLRRLLNKPVHVKPVIGASPEFQSKTTAPLFPRPGDDVAPTHETHADISRILKYAPAELIGRETELQLLDETWAQVQSGASKRPHVLTFVALGGGGKTSLVAKWAAELASQNWPGCDAVFAWTFYSQGARDQSVVSSDLFLSAALNFFGSDEDKKFGTSGAGAYEKGQRLARIVGQHHALLILDGIEPLQYPPSSPTAGQFKDQGAQALLKGLATINKGLCIVTTREKLTDLRAFWDNTVPQNELKRLSTPAGVALLRKLSISGSKNELEQLVEDVKGHALTLNLIGSYLRDAHGGDIRKRDLIKFQEADEEEYGGHVFRVMDAYVRWFESDGKKGKRALAALKMLGLFDRPATEDCLRALQVAPAIKDLTDGFVGVNEANRNLTFSRLSDANLISVNRDRASRIVSIDAHPLLREYFAERTKTENPVAWRIAHARIFQQLCLSTKEGNEPRLEDLQPLYQAVGHGCHAAQYERACDEVFRMRILRGKSEYSWRKLGAFGSDLGAIACFFEQPWSRISTSVSKSHQGFLLAYAAFGLRNLGRLTESVEPMRAAMALGIEQEDWANIAKGAGTLSQSELALGDIAAALRDAEQSVVYASRSGDKLAPVSPRTTLAHALHQAGRPSDAQTQFCEAEQALKGAPPALPLLHSTGGFRYGELLLTQPEHIAWRTILRLQIQNSEHPTLRAVIQRASQLFEWRKQSKWNPVFDTLLDVALDHLTLGRAFLYTAIIGGVDFRIPNSELFHIDAAVDGLRRASSQEYLVGGLITRAWRRFLGGTRSGPESAGSDLDEAWEIAERGPMKLVLADIHLHRARLFFREKEYPWKSAKDDLDAAEKLINECGYHRRDEELKDARAVVG